MTDTIQRQAFTRTDLIAWLKGHGIDAERLRARTSFIECIDGTTRVRFYGEQFKHPFELGNNGFTLERVVDTDLPYPPFPLDWSAHPPVGASSKHRVYLDHEQLLGD